ncbi:MAG: U32 family peptidase [Bacilli bacterium]|nr:U32 family peptidase [Bacilli bacterium]
MTEIYIPLPSKENFELYSHQCFDGFFIGIKGLSSNFNSYIDEKELKSVIDVLNKSKKKIFICLNRLYYNSEIDKVKDFIIKISKFDITGICYTDLGVLNILNEIRYDKDIFWISNHLGTNSKTVNFLEKRNVSYALLSTEITLDEVISIKKNTNINIGIKLYGFLNMATSSRKLLSNYFDYIKENNEKNNYIIEDKVKKEKYKVVEDRDTNFFTGKVLNGIKYLPKLIDNGLDFIILDDYMLSTNDFYNIIEAFSSLRNAKDDKDFVNNIIDVVNCNTYYDIFDGFLNKKTVYKVEDYE